MHWLSEIGPGWHDLVRPLIERCAAEGVTIYRVKQKFGGLRFQAHTGTDHPASDELREAIRLAEAHSFTICEECGHAGVLRGGPRVRTLCDTHEVQRLLGLISRIELIASASDGNYQWAVNRIGGIAADILIGAQQMTAATNMHVAYPPVAAPGATVGSEDSTLDESLRPRELLPEDEQYHGLDTSERVCFYEQDFYVLSNFSAFRIRLLVDDGSGGEVHCTFDTSEAAYHWFKFPHLPELQAYIRAAQSAHAAFKLAEQYRARRRPDWDSVKVDVMREILRAKVEQHEYVRRKLLATGDRELVENSWRDDFWGWGPNRDGQNMLGRLWMDIRTELQDVE